MGYFSHRVDPTEIKPGDHIYTWRTGYVYSHHGIYVGEKMVIHFNRTPEKADSGSVWDISSSSFTSHPASCLNSHDCGFLHPSTGGDCGSMDKSSSSFTSHPASCLNSHDCGFLHPSSGGDCGSMDKSSSSFTSHPASCLNSHDCGFLHPSSGGDCGSMDKSSSSFTSHPASCLNSHDCGFLHPSSGGDCGSMDKSSSSFTSHPASCLNSHDCGFLHPSSGGDCGSMDKSSSSFTSHPASCLNSHDCGFLHPSTGGDCGSGLSTCSHCTSWNPNIPAACLRLPHCGYHQPDSGVFISCLNCFIDTGSLYRFQYGVGKLSYISKIRGGTCTTAKSDPPDEVIEKALHLLLHGFGSYDVVKNNCEDFALYCTTGLMIRGKVTTGSSGQVNFITNVPWKTTITFVVGKIVFNSLGVVSMAATSVGTYSWNRYKADIGVRDDVEKVAVEEVVEFRRRNM